jgi:hypothetical protein
VAFRLNVDGSAEAYHVTYDVYGLLCFVLRREFDFPQLIRMFTRARAEFEARQLLDEAEVLKDMARVRTRPYIDPGRELEGFELEGMIAFPRLLTPEAQIVQDWGQLVQEPDGPLMYLPSPPTLLAGLGRLYLVDAIAHDVAEVENWTDLPHLSAEELCWEGGRLLADGEPTLQLPAEYQRPGGNWTVLRCCDVPVYQAWGEQIEQLIRACRDALALGRTMVTSFDPPEISASDGSIGDAFQPL